VNDSSVVVVLQHGSILCGPAHRRLADYLMLDNDQLSPLRTALHEKTTDLSQATGNAVDMQRLEECLRKGFESAWGISFNEIEPEHITGKDAYV
jgi:lipoate-protein ligase A